MGRGEGRGLQDPPSDVFGMGEGSVLRRILNCIKEGALLGGSWIPRCLVLLRMGSVVSPEAVRSVSSAALLGGRKMLVIVHGSEEYRLQITRSGKLILTK